MLERFDMTEFLTGVLESLGGELEGDQCDLLVDVGSILRNGPQTADECGAYLRVKSALAELATRPDFWACADFAECLDEEVYGHFKREAFDYVLQTREHLACLRTAMVACLNATENYDTALLPSLARVTEVLEYVDTRIDRAKPLYASRLL